MENILSTKLVFFLTGLTQNLTSLPTYSLSFLSLPSGLQVLSLCLRVSFSVYMPFSLSITLFLSNSRICLSLDPVSASQGKPVAQN